MTFGEVFDGLQKFGPLVGPTGLVILIIVAMGAIVFMGYQFLAFGHRAFEFALPYIGQILQILRGENQRQHLALDVERYLHLLFFAILFFCFTAIILHALVPWGGHHMEYIGIAFIGSVVVCVALAGVSLTVAVRSPHRPRRSPRRPR
jgi:hypothetical protein